MAAMVDGALLKGSYLMHGLTDDQIGQVAALAEVRLCSPGRVVANVNDVSDEVYFVLEGNLVVTTEDGDKLGEVGPNSVIGEMGLVDARPRTANVTCRDRVTLAVVSAKGLRKLMSDNREWGFILLSNIARVLAGRLRQADARIDELADKATDAWDHAMG